MKEILYDWGGANVQLFHLINNVHAGWLDQFMLLGTAIGDHTSFVPILCLLMLAAIYTVPRAYVQGAQRGEQAAYLWLGTVAVFVLGYWLDGVIVSALKPWVDFPRPPLALGEAHVHIVGEAKFHHSFPSGHASFAMLVCASFWPLGRWWRIGGAFFLIWVGLSRISLGAHFPADVLGGFLLSLLVVLVVRAWVNGFINAAGRRRRKTD